MKIILPSNGRCTHSSMEMFPPKIEHLRRAADLSADPILKKNEFLEPLLKKPEQLKKITCDDRDYLFCVATSVIYSGQIAFVTECECGYKFNDKHSLDDMLLNVLNNPLSCKKVIFGVEYTFNTLLVEDEAAAAEKALIDDETYEQVLQTGIVLRTLGKELTPENYVWADTVLDLSVYLLALVYQQCQKHGLDLRKEVVCPKCHLAMESVLPITGDLLKVDMNLIMDRFKKLLAHGLDFKAFADLTLVEYNVLVQKINQK